MKKVFNVYNITLILVVALIGVLTLRTTEVKAAGTITWTNGSTVTLSRTVQNVYNAPEVDFTYGISTEDTSIVTLKTATFDNGETVNRKMKNTANYDIGYGYDIPDQALVAIKRSQTLPNYFVATTENTVSASNSEYPIYIFFDDEDGTMYYYSEADTIYLNANSSQMFRDMRALTDISGLSEVDTSRVTNMHHMFQVCSALTSISALSNWNTSSVTYMDYMFCDCANLANINGASSWNTSAVTEMRSMFENDTKASGTIQILGNPTIYNSAFRNAATASGAEITVNYGSSTSNINNIIATKSNNSNVVKGSQVSVPASSNDVIFNRKTLSFDGSETVSNSYTVSKSSTINLSNIGLNFTKPGNYELKVKEISTSNSAYPIDDDNEYTIVIQVTNVLDANNVPTGNFNATFAIKDDNDTKVNNMPFSEPKDESKFGYIEVSKTVKGVMADRTEEFEFSIQVDDDEEIDIACENYSGSEKYLISGTGITEDGNEVTKCKSGTKDTIHLTHGQSATIGRFTYNNNNYNSISIDDYYSIFEDEKDGYTTSFKVGSGSETISSEMSPTAVSNGANSVTFYNQNEGSPVTGFILTILPYLILIGLGVVGISLYKKDWSQVLIKMRDK
ncbi:MAG: BspA family leucine-rich repeat surface protein [Bacilli bacterium]|nr:BspA family leucine-rich repeat surface protein [Bacilli bacterium]